jgi:hypothetical protein
MARIKDVYAPGKDGLKPLKDLRSKKRIKYLKPLFSNMAALGGPIKFLSTLPDPLLGAKDGVVHLDDPDVIDLLSRLDTRTPEDEKMAQRVVAMKRTRFPGAPYTELMVYDWFSRNGVQFDYQVPLGGGRSTKLGQVLDFAVYSGGSAIAIPVQGQYWHSKADVAASDELDKLSALGQLVNGFRIDYYIPIWERRLYSDRKTVISSALGNIDLGP